MYELHFAGIRSRTVKGLVKWVHLKSLNELRLRGINMQEATNAFAEEFMTD